jgi:hypothetical protein
VALRTVADLLLSKPMRLWMIALLPLLTSLPLVAQDAEAQKKFAGTWEAKWKDKIICTLRLKAGEQISGEMEACNINADANGDLQERSPPIIQIRLHQSSMRKSKAIR